MAAYASMPVEINGISGAIKGTAWACMFEPINARFASSCSRNGIKRRADTYYLVGGHIHIIDAVRPRNDEIRMVAAGNAIHGKFIEFVDRGICLGDHKFIFSIRREIFDLFRYERKHKNIRPVLSFLMAGSISAVIRSFSLAITSPDLGSVKVFTQLRGSSGGDRLEEST